MKKVISTVVVVLVMVAIAAVAGDTDISGEVARGQFRGGTVRVPILFQPGAATAPAVAWLADSDGTGTGIYRSGTNEVAIANNGVGSWFYNASGHLQPVTHNTVDLGLTGTRVRNIFAVGLTVTGTPIFSGGVNLGGGTTISYSVSGSATLNFADQLGIYGCEELTLTCTGAATTGTPACMVGAAGAVAGGNVHCRVSAANTCAIQYCGTGDPASQTYRATVLAP